MRVALITTFAASKKEPLVTVMDRIHQAFLDAGLGEPSIRFNFGDAPLAGFVSSVDRVLKRQPVLERFVTSAAPMPNIPGARRISNGPGSPAAGEAIAFSTLQTIAAGVPRSFPFHNVALHFYSAEFGELVLAGFQSPEKMTGILLSDSWWVNGRMRSLSACTIVEAGAGSKKLPPHPAPLAAILAACGKAKSTVQVPIAPEGSPIPEQARPETPANFNPAAASAVKEIVLDYRARLMEILERAQLPHDLAAPRDAIRERTLGAPTGPKKPALEAAFKPLGYTCRGNSGTFTLRRRTAGNLTVELSLDVGTWGQAVLAIFNVRGVGWKATLIIPPCAKAVVRAQYPIIDGDHWQKIVANLAAMVAELDRSFVPAVEAAAGPSPEWYQPES